MGIRKGADKRFSTDGRHLSATIPYRVLRAVKEMGPATAYMIWRHGSVSKHETVERYLGILSLIGAIEEQEGNGRTVYSITRFGESSLKSMCPMFENMIYGRTVLPAGEEQESHYTNEEIMDNMRDLTDHLKKKGMIETHYQLPADRGEHAPIEMDEWTSDQSKRGRSQHQKNLTRPR